MSAGDRESTAGRRSLIGDLDVEELIREAQAEARAAVKARLRADVERALLQEAAERLTPRSDERSDDAGDGLWIYCVIRGDHAGKTTEVPGVHAGGAPRIIHTDGIAAVVSSVPLAEFGEEALRRNLNDLDWLESVARAHENVIESNLAGGPVVPMRVCTIFRGEEHVRAMLERRRTAFERALETLAGTAEWGVKVTLDRARVTEAAGAQTLGSAPAGGETGGEGGAYLGRKRADRELRAQADTMLDEALRECHARLEEWAAASELLPPQRRELGDYAGEMVFNGAYLVDDDRADRFAEVVDELSHHYAGEGLSFELTGPWPAFHFVGSLGVSEEPVG